MQAKTLIPLLITAILFIIGRQACSQTIIPRFENLGVNDGLPHSSVYSITQDKKGFMWFGTPDGLCRYDGSEIKRFKYHSENAGDVVNNIVRGKMLEDEAGNIWYCNESAIYKWDAVKSQVVKVRSFNLAEFESVEFRCIALDANGRLWLFNIVGGVFEFNIHSGRLIQYPFPQHTNTFSLLSTYTSVDEAGNFWLRLVSNNDAYFVFNKSTHTYSTQLANDPPHAIFFGQHKMVQAFDDKLVYKNLQNGETHTIPKIINNKKISFFSFEGIRDNYGRLWMTSRSNGGLYYYDEIHYRFTEYHHDNSKIKSLPFDLTTCLYIDRSENLWIGMDGGGVAKLDLKQPKFNLFPLSEGDYPVLNDYFTKCFYEDNKGRIWFGSHTNGLNILDRKTGALLNYHNQKNNPNSLPGNIVGSIFKDSDGNMWVGSSGGISLFNEKRRSFKTIVLHDMPKLNAKLNSFVYKIIQMKNGELVAATLRGLIKVVKQKKQGYSAFLLTDNPYLGATTTDVIEMTDGTIYATLPGIGLNELKYKGKKYIISNIFLPGIDLRSVRADETNAEYLWVCTGKGLIHFNIATQKYKIWDEKNGLANSYVYGSLEDEKHNLWISTNGGLSYLDRNTNHLDNYTYQDGLQSNEFNTQAFYKSPANTFYFGGIKGFNWFKSAPPNNVHPIPQVAITKIEILDEAFQKDSAFFSNRTITVPYNKNAFNFQFAALDYTRPEANKIQYILQDWDRSWITTSTRSVRYSNLLPGKYTFRVKASNADGIWSTEENIYLVIETPFWQRIWFVVLVVLLLLGAIIFITYKILQLKTKRKLQLLEKQIAIDAERDRISADMHDEIGSGLTHIALLSEVMQAQHKKGSDINRDITSISNSAGKLVQTMSEIIWALNPQNDTLENLLAYIREQSHQYFEGMNISFSINFPEAIPEIKLTNEQRRNLFLVTKEALSNALKHSQAACIDLSLVITKDKYCFNVKDNGVGMPANKLKIGSNGVKNMKKRMKDIGGTIVWRNEIKGTLAEYCLRL